MQSSSTVGAEQHCRYTTKQQWRWTGCSCNWGQGEGWVGWWWAAVQYPCIAASAAARGWHGTALHEVPAGQPYRHQPRCHTPNDSQQRCFPTSACEQATSFAGCKLSCMCLQAASGITSDAWLWAAALQCSALRLSACPVHAASSKAGNLCMPLALPNSHGRWPLSRAARLAWPPTWLSG